MEEFARRTNMRQWAKIGMSTIYKTLGDLEREGAIAVEIEQSDKGPARKAFALTDLGRRRMVELIGNAVTASSSVYSDRIAGLVFVPLIGSQHATAAVSASIKALEQADEKLAENTNADGMDEIGLAVIEFYRSIYAAEREAMRRVLAVVRAKQRS
jgi:DNA-binding PadR family transcriptional regulator